MSRFSRAAASLMLVVALAAGNAGCISDPSIKIAGARISNVSLVGVDLTMTMAVHNPNSFDVMVRDMSKYALQLYSKPSSTAKQMELCQKMIAKPVADPARFDRVWQGEVFALRGRYQMSP